MKTIANIRIIIPIGISCWAVLGFYLPVSFFLIGSILLLTSFSALLFIKLGLLKSSQQIIATIEKFKAGDRTARVPSQRLDELASVGLAINDLLNNAETEEWRLNEKRIRYKSLIEMMADGLITINRKGSIESMNSAAGKLLGFKENELIGVEISTIITDPKSHSAEDYLNGFIDDETGGTPNQEIEVVSKNGDKIPILFAVSKMVAQTQLLYIGVLSDISKIKSMEIELRSLNDELSRTNERLEKTAITDSLTSLFNRRHFDSVLIKELQRATRQRTSISLLIVDIDFFKQFNDLYGHTAGDECIKKVSSCIRQVFKRSGDLPARYGGEEFTIILPGCDGLELQERAETLRREIVELRIPHRDSNAEKILTVSIGAITYKPGVNDTTVPKPKELFSEADKALYRAKAKGRNQVVFAGQYQPLVVPKVTDQLYGQFMSR
jgi:diguanylate cyclase (GGDEF)-like protein/PAS domain S-box-containing protein